MHYVTYYNVLSIKTEYFKKYSGGKYASKFESKNLEFFIKTFIFKSPQS